MAMKSADCIIALGCRFSDRSIGNRDKFGVGLHIVHVDVDRSELSKNTNDEYGIVGDVGLAIRRLLPLLVRADHRGWRDLVAKLRADEALQTDGRPGMTPRAVLAVADAHRDRDGVVVTDVGQHQMWAAQYLHFDRPRSLVTNGGLGAMGFGLPAAIGAALATGRRTLLVVGDGGFGMSLHELATAVSVEAPLTILVMDNGVLGMVRQWQSMFYDKRFASTTLRSYRHTDFVAVAKAFGTDGMAANTMDELEAAFAKADVACGPYLIDCAIDADELVLPMLSPGGTLGDIIVKVVN
jgi:acetolactate synthase-1/2/3 large subunit